MTKPKLLLWDVDGTLIDSGNTPQILYPRLANQVLGRDDVTVSKTPVDGKTDYVNCTNILIDAGVSPETLSDRRSQMLHLLPDVFADMVDEKIYPGRALEGASATLEACKDAGAINTLLTGNLAESARLKMQFVGFDPFLNLRIGAYGGDAPTRSELLPIAVDRARVHLGIDFEPSDIWVIGDTPGDYQVAADNGVNSLLLASGPFDYDELAALKPTQLLHNLSKPHLAPQALGVDLEGFAFGV